MLQRPRACTQSAGATRLSFGFWEASDSDNSPAPRVGPGAAPAPASPYPHHSQVLIGEPLARGQPESPRVQTQHKRAGAHTCSQSPWPGANGVWRGRVNCVTLQPRNLRQLFFWAEDGNKTAQAWGDASHPCQLLTRWGSWTSGSMLKPRAHCPRQVVQKEDGVDYWRLRGFRRIKWLSTGTVPCAGLDAPEPFNFDNNLLVSYCWVHSRYQHALKSHSAFVAQQQRKVIPPHYSQKGRERIFILSSQNRGDFLHPVSSLKTFSLLVLMVSGEQNRVYRERSNN